MMRVIPMLMLVAAAGCGSGESAPEPAGNNAEPPHVSYALEGLITGRRLFFSRDRCLAMLKSYAEAMEVGLGQGGGSQLKCVPAPDG
jgi:hypothetical protein